MNKDFLALPSSFLLLFYVYFHCHQFLDAPWAQPLLGPCVQWHHLSHFPCKGWFLAPLCHQTATAIGIGLGRTTCFGQWNESDAMGTLGQKVNNGVKQEDLASLGSRSHL